MQADCSISRRGSVHVPNLADPERTYEALLNNLQNYRASYKDKCCTVEQYVHALKSLNDFIPEGLLHSEPAPLRNYAHCVSRGQFRQH